MKIQHAITSVALAALVAGLVATGASAEPVSRTSAIASSANGDNWMAANLFEEARAANDSPANRFNLAVAYEITGRASEAATLYRAIVRSPSAEATLSPIRTKAEGDASRTGIVQAARQHLARIDARHGAPAADEFEVGASASASVGGPSSGRVSNADARRLDDEARNAHGE